MMEAMMNEKRLSVELSLGEISEIRVALISKARYYMEAAQNQEVDDLTRENAYRAAESCSDLAERLRKEAASHICAASRDRI